MSKLFSTFTPGKILITGEYCILYGAKGWTLPTKLGQHLSVESNHSNQLHFISSDQQGVFFDSIISMDDLEPINPNNSGEEEFVCGILNAIQQLKPDFFKGLDGAILKSYIEFNKEFGLGSSSTFIVNMANWAGVDAFELHQLVSKGSGYDIVVGNEKCSIVYQKTKDAYSVTKQTWKVKDTSRIRFIYSGRKQKTEGHIRQFKPNKGELNKAIVRISEITEYLLQCTRVDECFSGLREHEQIIASLLKQRPIQNELFSDFKGVVKSSGAWGGDFFIAFGEETEAQIQSYFQAKGFSTQLSWSEMFGVENSH